MRRSTIADQMPVSGIRKMFALASKYENVINLCIGEPDFETPQHIIDAGAYALNHVTLNMFPIPVYLLCGQQLQKK